MKLTFITSADLFNPKSWPRQAVGNWGSNYWMAKTLEKGSESFTYIGNLEEWHSGWAKLERRVYQTLFPHQVYHYWAEPSVNRHYVRQITAQLEKIKPDVIFSPHISLLAYLKYPTPKVLWTDTTYGGFPEGFGNCCGRSQRQLQRLDALALRNSDLVIFSSDWAAQTAQALYDVDAEKIKVVPTGANMECDRTPAAIQAIIKSKPLSPCHLLFIGVDWERKGGDIAWQIAQRLHQSGFPIQLTIIGTQPQIQQPFPDFLKVINFIDKSTASGRKQMDSLFAQSHFLILPTRADVTPAVIREASSFGVPSLSTKVGGIPTLIRAERNGQLFDLDGTIEEYCEYITTVFSDPVRYQQLAISSFAEYQERLNWQKAGESVYRLIQELILSDSLEGL